MPKIKGPQQLLKLTHDILSAEYCQYIYAAVRDNLLYEKLEQGFVGFVNDVSSEPESTVPLDSVHSDMVSLLEKLYVLRKNPSKRKLIDCMLQIRKLETILPNLKARIFHIAFHVNEYLSVDRKLLDANHVSKVLTDIHYPKEPISLHCLETCSDCNSKDNLEEAIHILLKTANEIPAPSFSSVFQKENCKMLYQEVEKLYLFRLTFQSSNHLLEHNYSFVHANSTDKLDNRLLSEPNNEEDFFNCDGDTDCSNDVSNNIFENPEISHTINVLPELSIKAPTDANSNMEIKNWSDMVSTNSDTSVIPASKDTSDAESCDGKTSVSEHHAGTQTDFPDDSDDYLLGSSTDSFSTLCMDTQLGNNLQRRTSSEISFANSPVGSSSSDEDFKMTSTPKSDRNCVKSPDIRGNISNMSALSQSFQKSFALFLESSGTSELDQTVILRTVKESSDPILDKVCASTAANISVIDSEEPQLRLLLPSCEENDGLVINKNSELLAAQPDATRSSGFSTDPSNKTLNQIVTVARKPPKRTLVIQMKRLPKEVLSKFCYLSSEPCSTAPKNINNKESDYTNNENGTQLGQQAEPCCNPTINRLDIDSTLIDSCNVEAAVETSKNISGCAEQSEHTLEANSNTDLDTDQEVLQLLKIITNKVCNSLPNSDPEDVETGKNLQISIVETSVDKIPTDNKSEDLLKDTRNKSFETAHSSRKHRLKMRSLSLPVMSSSNEESNDSSIATQSTLKSTVRTRSSSKDLKPANNSVGDFSRKLRNHPCVISDSNSEPQANNENILRIRTRQQRRAALNNKSVNLIIVSSDSEVENERNVDSLETNTNLCSSEIKHNQNSVPSIAKNFQSRNIDFHKQFSIDSEEDFVIPSKRLRHFPPNAQEDNLDTSSRSDAGGHVSSSSTCSSVNDPSHKKHRRKLYKGFEEHIKAVDRRRLNEDCILADIEIKAGTKRKSTCKGKWSLREEEKLVEGVMKYGNNNWKKIAAEYKLKRSSRNVYDKWRNIVEYEHLDEIKARMKLGRKTRMK